MPIGLTGADSGTTSCAVGGRVKFTVYPGVGHGSWGRTYANPEFYDWLLAQQRGKPQQPPSALPQPGD
jgi:hypothetical protein